MSKLTNIQVSELFKYTKTEEFGLIGFKQPRQYLLVQRNIKRLKDVYEALVKAEEQVVKLSPEMEEFTAAKVEQISPYLEKDELGNVIQQKDGSVNILEGKDHLVRIILASLSEKYKEAIDQHNKKLKDWQDFLNTEADIEIDLIPFDDVILPSSFNNKQFATLSLMLEI